MTRISSLRHTGAVAALLATAAAGCHRGKSCDPGYLEDRASPQGVWCRKPDGTEIIYMQLYADGGQRRERCRFVGGQLEGPFSGWHQGGQRWVEGQFAHGHLEGVWRQWEVGGRMVAEGEYRNGKLVSGAPVGMAAAICSTVTPP